MKTTRMIIRAPPQHTQLRVLPVQLQPLPLPLLLLQQLLLRKPKQVQLTLLLPLLRTGGW